jgi:hypothetical protein
VPEQLENVRIPLTRAGISRRGLLAGLAGVAAVPLLGACGGGSDSSSDDGGSGKGPVSIGSNSSDPASKAAWQATFDAFTKAKGIQTTVTPLTTTPSSSRSTAICRARRRTCSCGTRGTGCGPWSTPDSSPT